MSQSSSCPADVLLPNWSNGCPVALEVHVISPLQSLTLSEAAFSQGHALQVGVQRKLAANLPNCRSSGLDCIPLVAETLGSLAEDLLLPSKQSANPFASALALTENLTPPATSLDKSVWPCGEAMPLCLSITLQPSLPPLMAWHERIHSHKKTILCLVLFTVCIFIVFIILSEGAQAKKKIL